LSKEKQLYDKPFIATWHRKYEKLHLEKYRKNGRAFTHKWRMKIIEILGSKCVRCGESDWRCLQVDHIDGGGSKDLIIRSGSTRYKIFYEEIIKGSKKFQLLCANCNWKKRYENKEGYIG
jgi:hypothetical protein